ncbi:hypothetical protein [Terrabacter sp. Root181]|uniref:hypothetical protein n=1 Tax=Terrabacter sp. Root181 TaxID=1736484 RepID=UPI0007007ABD|nr:hypothetical protein [Terrabacter sp. Root181]KRB45005.1 hypothetical protein ASD90_15025 [Terrabacter sp. Root181]
MDAGQHRQTAERLATDAVTRLADGETEAASTLATLAQAHATIAQADAVSTVAHWLEPRPREADDTDQTTTKETRRATP